MPFKSPETALHDIKENITLARQFIAGLSFDDFVADPKTIYAVIRALAVYGKTLVGRSGIL